MIPCRTRREPLNFTPVGDQFDFVRSPARTMHPNGLHRTCRWTDNITKNTHPATITALLRNACYVTRADARAAAVQSLRMVAGGGLGFKPELEARGFEKHLHRCAELEQRKQEQEVPARHTQTRHHAHTQRRLASLRASVCACPPCPSHAHTWHLPLPVFR